MNHEQRAHCRSVIAEAEKILNDIFLSNGIALGRKIDRQLIDATHLLRDAHGLLYDPPLQCPEHPTLGAQRA